MRHISEIIPQVLEDIDDSDADLRRCGFDSRPVEKCQNCGGRHVELRLSRSGPHVRGDCSVCGKYVKFVRNPGVMPFGKYKGKRFVDLPKSYLAWMRRTPEVMSLLDEHQKKIIEEVLG